MYKACYRSYNSIQNWFSGAHIQFGLDIFLLQCRQENLNPDWGSLGSKNHGCLVRVPKTHWVGAPSSLIYIQQIAQAFGAIRCSLLLICKLENYCLPFWEGRFFSCLVVGSPTHLPKYAQVKLVHLPQRLGVNKKNS